MKKNSLITLALAIAFFAFAGAVGAQVTIRLPKIPKVNKPKETKPEPAPTATKSSDRETPKTETKPSDDETKSENSADDQEIPPFYQVHLEEIEKRRREVEEFQPGDRGWLVGESTYNYLLFAVSPRARRGWFADSKIDQDTAKNQKFINDALDRLAAAAAKQLPRFLLDTSAYPAATAVEAKLMKGKIKDLADHKFFHVGLQRNWRIGKNSIGLIENRFRYGAVWVRFNLNDHSYCRIYYINVVQDYAGGGTYGASYANFVDDVLAGCPPGK